MSQDVHALVARGLALFSLARCGVIPASSCAGWHAANHGMPTGSTLGKVFDNLDLMRGVESFLTMHG
jgi:hypothetical protein